MMPWIRNLMALVEKNEEAERGNIQTVFKLSKA